MTLWLVRHGATEWSERGKLCGWTDVPLSPLGRDQAIRLRPRLERHRFDGVWTSDLARAREFARLSFDGAHPDSRLREVDFGDLEGLTWDECDPQTRDALSGFGGFTAPGGESVESFQDRVVGFLTELGPGNHLIFTHGGVIRLLHMLCGQSRAPAPGEMVELAWPAPARIRTRPEILT